MSRGMLSPVGGLRRNDRIRELTFTTFLFTFPITNSLNGCIRERKKKQLGPETFSERLLLSRSIPVAHRYVINICINVVTIICGLLTPQKHQ